MLELFLIKCTCDFAEIVNCKAGKYLHAPVCHQARWVKNVTFLYTAHSRVRSLCTLSTLTRLSKTGGGARLSSVNNTAQVGTLRATISARLKSNSNCEAWISQEKKKNCRKPLKTCPFHVEQCRRLVKKKQKSYVKMPGTWRWAWDQCRSWSWWAHPAPSSHTCSGPPIIGYIHYKAVGYSSINCSVYNAFFCLFLDFLIASFGFTYLRRLKDIHCKCKCTKSYFCDKKRRYFLLLFVLSIEYD